MKKITGLSAVLLVLVLGMTMLAGCSNDADAEDESSSDYTYSSETSSEDDDAETADVIGQVTYVGSTYLSISVYEAEEEVTDYASLDVATLTSTGSSDSVTLDTDAAFQYVYDGVLYTTTLDELYEGDLIAITYDEEGIQTIIILETTDDDMTDDEVSDDLIGMVDEIGEDSLTLGLYDSDVAISDYTDLTSVTLTDSYTTQSVSLESDVTVKYVSSGLLVETTLDDLSEGDMVVITTDEYGYQLIIILDYTEDVSE